MRFKDHLIKLGHEDTGSSMYGDVCILIDHTGKIHLDIATGYGLSSDIKTGSFLFNEYTRYSSVVASNSNNRIRYIINVSQSYDPFIIYGLLKKVRFSSHSGIIPENSFFNEFIKMLNTVVVPPEKFNEIYYPDEDHYLRCIDEKIIKSCIYSKVKLNEFNHTLYSKAYDASPTKVIKKYVDSITDADVHLFASVPVSTISELVFKEFSTPEEFALYYSEKAYSDGTGTLGSSCMRHSKCQDAVKFYGMIDSCKLLTIYNTNTNLIHGRCLKWDVKRFNTQTKEIDNITLLDRFYANENVVKFHNMFIKHSESKGYYYMGRQSYGTNSIMSNGNTFNVVLNADDDRQGRYVIFAEQDCQNWDAISSTKIPYLDNMSGFIYVHEIKKLFILMNPSDYCVDSDYMQNFYNLVCKKLYPDIGPVYNAVIRYNSYRSTGMEKMYNFLHTYN